MRRAAALLEVLGVFLVGQLVVSALVRALGLQITNPLPHFTAGITDSELVAASRQMFVLLLVQYVGWFLLIVPINLWHRGRGLAAYGLTTAGIAWSRLLLAGAATVALAAWLPLTVQLVDAAYDLGETVAWRQAFFDTSWRRWEFWLFSAVLSWAFVAIVEELFYRGYCQRRLAEDFGDGPAIVGVACLFTFAHSQYLNANAYNVAMLVSLLVLATAFGIVFARTRSLVPSILGHALINVPMTSFWQSLFLAACVIGAFVAARRAWKVASRVFSGASVTSCLTLAAIGIGFWVAVRRLDRAELAGAVMVVVALGLEAVDRSKRRAATWKE